MGTKKMENDVITLITTTNCHDEQGLYQESSRQEFEMMAQIQSAKRDEFYKAIYAGVNVQLMVTVNYRDYEAAVIQTEDGSKWHPAMVEYDNTTYRIVRAYRKRRKMELTLQEAE